MTTINAGPYIITLTGETGPFTPTLTAREADPGIFLVELTLTSDAAAKPGPLTLDWEHPSVDIQAHWDTGCGWDRSKGVNWGGGRTSKATSQAPVVSLFNGAGRSRLTFAFSDALHPVKYQAGVVEETGLYDCHFKLFTEPGPTMTHYAATVRLDTRGIPYFESLAEVGDWWAGLPGYTPAPVPDAARRPMYSTWYSMHQDVTPESIEEQCRLARDLGCHAVIVDDGWQTADSARGYGHTGDWQPAPERIPDMAAHVRRVHDLGLKYLLWYSVPFVGVHSQAYKRFEDKLLSTQKFDMGDAFGVLDPRFPDVRAYLIETYENALRDWDLDGFKLDFVDSFSLPQEKQHETDPRRDLESVDEAVDVLLTDVMARLRALKPDVCVEFRQSYVGPLMRKYGNMFRAGDCPNDALNNRIRTLDIRLLCGDTAAHADMTMWRGDEPVEAAAQQIVHTLFAVPQISVLLDALPADHLEMVRWWLGFWNDNRDVLLDGKLQPLHPELLYPVVIANTEKKCVIAAYADMVLRPGPDVPETLWIVNGVSVPRLVVELAGDLGLRRLTIRDCRGRTVHEEDAALGAGLYAWNVPPSGTLCLSCP